MEAKPADISEGRGDSSVAAVDMATTRRRMQNRVAQRNHRARSQHARAQPNKKHSKELVWTEPNTILTLPGRAEKKYGSHQQQEEQVSSSPRSKCVIRPLQNPALGHESQQQRINRHQHSDIQAPGQESTTSMAPLDTQWVNDTIPENDDQAFDAYKPHLLSVDLSKGGDEHFGGATFLSDVTNSTHSGPWDLMNFEDYGGESADEGAGESDGDSNELSGYNALHLAAYHGHKSIARLLLLRRPADANVTTGEGQSALHIAAAGHHVDVVRDLLERGADLSLQDNLGRTPLHVAVIAGAQSVAQLLAERAIASLHVRDFAGCTPLHTAVLLGHEETVHFLLDRGADPNATVMY